MDISSISLVGVATYLMLVNKCGKLLPVTRCRLLDAGDVSLAASRQSIEAVNDCLLGISQRHGRLFIFRYLALDRCPVFRLFDVVSGPPVFIEYIKFHVVIIHRMQSSVRPLVDKPCRG